VLLRDQSLNTEEGGGDGGENKIFNRIFQTPSILMKFLWDPPHTSYIFKDPPSWITFKIFYILLCYYRENAMQADAIYHPFAGKELKTWAF
jgi:hypothetical protein